MIGGGLLFSQFVLTTFGYATQILHFTCRNFTPFSTTWNDSIHSLYSLAKDICSSVSIFWPLLCWLRFEIDDAAEGSTLSVLSVTLLIWMFCSTFSWFDSISSSFLVRVCFVSVSQFKIHKHVNINIFPSGFACFVFFLLLLFISTYLFQKTRRSFFACPWYDDNDKTYINNQPNQVRTQTNFDTKWIDCLHDLSRTVFVLMRDILTVAEFVHFFLSFLRIHNLANGHLIQHSR